MADVVVIDVDAGIDDIYALILLINAEAMCLVTIAAIICSAGNTILLHSCRNVVRILEILNRTDIPVYRGVNKTLVAPTYFDGYFGSDGFGDVEGLWEPDMNLLREDNAAEMLYKLTKNYPGEISLISVGPLSFAAITLIQYDHLPLKDVWIMGGNSTESNKPEFNWRRDPEAAYGVLTRIGVPIYILTYQNSEDLNLTMRWRGNTLGAVNNKVMYLMNAAENLLLDRYTEDHLWTMCDVILIATMFYPQVDVTQTQYCGTVSLNNKYPKSGGFLILESNCSNPNIILLENINAAAYADVLYSVLSSF